MSPNRLTNTQLVILSAASQREDRAIELAPNLKGGAARKVVGKLQADGLIEEIEASGSLPVWRHGDDKGPLALRITERGRAAIQADQHGAREEAENPGNVEVGADRAPDKLPRRIVATSRRKTKDESPRRSDKSGQAASKQNQVIEMLQRRQGATVATIMKATGWQPHSVRGFFAGVVRNRLGLNLVSEKTGEQRIYRIVAKAASAQRKGKSTRKAA